MVFVIFKQVFFMCLTFVAACYGTSYYTHNTKNINCYRHHPQHPAAAKDFPLGSCFIVLFYLVQKRTFKINLKQYIKFKLRECISMLKAGCCLL